MKAGTILVIGGLGLAAYWFISRSPNAMGFGGPVHVTVDQRRSPVADVISASGSLIGGIGDLVNSWDDSGYNQAPTDAGLSWSQGGSFTFSK